MEKINYLPTLHDAETELLPGQLEVLHQQVILEGGDNASTQSKFNYAWGLIKSNDIAEQRLGIKILSDIYKDTPQRRRECLYYLSIGCYKSHEYTMAKKYIDALSEHEPDNRQVKMLKQMIEEKIKDEAWKGLMIGSGFVAGAAILTGWLVRQRKK